MNALGLAGWMSRPVPRSMLALTPPRQDAVTRSIHWQAETAPHLQEPRASARKKEIQTPYYP